jgi:hypothetical protein
MKRRNLTAAAIAFGTACLVIADVSTPSAQLCAAEPQSFSEDILPAATTASVPCDMVQAEHEHPTRRLLIWREREDATQL